MKDLPFKAMVFSYDRQPLFWLAGSCSEAMLRNIMEFNIIIVWVIQAHAPLKCISRYLCKELMCSKSDVIH